MYSTLLETSLFSCNNSEIYALHFLLLERVKRKGNPNWKSWLKILIKKLNNFNWKMSQQNFFFFSLIFFQWKRGFQWKGNEFIKTFRKNKSAFLALKKFNWQMSHSFTIWNFSSSFKCHTFPCNTQNSRLVLCLAQRNGAEILRRFLLFCPWP